jgi:hypothetical protein
LLVFAASSLSDWGGLRHIVEVCDAKGAVSNKVVFVI